MHKIMPHISKVMFGLFMLGVFALVVSLTFSALGRIFQNDLFTQLAGISLFDFAALVWFGVFVYNSNSTGQYTAAAFGFAAGLLGAMGMIAIESVINMGMATPEEMGSYLVYVFVGVAISHLVLIYAHHAAAPDVSAKISIGVEKAKINENGMKQAEQILIQNQDVLGQILANKLLAEVLTDLHIPQGGSAPASLPALPVQEDAPEESFFGRIQSAFRSRSVGKTHSGSEERKYPANVPTVELSTEVPSSIPNTAPAGAEQPPVASV